MLLQSPYSTKKDTPLISYCGFEPLMLLRIVLYIIFFVLNVNLVLVSQYLCRFNKKFLYFFFIFSIYVFCHKFRLLNIYFITDCFELQTKTFKFSILKRTLDELIFFNISYFLVSFE